VALLQPLSVRDVAGAEPGRDVLLDGRVHHVVLVVGVAEAEGVGGLLGGGGGQVGDPQPGREHEGDVVRHLVAAVEQGDAGAVIGADHALAGAAEHHHAVGTAGRARGDEVDVEVLVQRVQVGDHPVDDLLPGQASGAGQVVGGERRDDLGLAVDDGRDVLHRVVVAARVGEGDALEVEIDDALALGVGRLQIGLAVRTGAGGVDHQQRLCPGPGAWTSTRRSSSAAAGAAATRSGAGGANEPESFESLAHVLLPNRPIAGSPGPA
jgi:hypothetical protein